MTQRLSIADRSVRAVVFDLGNVMVEWNPERLYRRLILDDDSRAEFLTTVVTAEWNRALDGGLPFDAAIADLQARHPRWAAEIAAYRDAWAEMLGPVDDEAVALVDELIAAGLPVYALTNWSAETFPLAEARYRFLERFEGVVVSGREGITKPDRAIFDLVCNRYGLDPATTLFTDDGPANVSGARAAGWQAVLWQGAAEFRHHVVDCGVLPPGPTL